MIAFEREEEEGEDKEELSLYTLLFARIERKENLTKKRNPNRIHLHLHKGRNEEEECMESRIRVILTR